MSAQADALLALDAAVPDVDVPPTCRRCNRAAEGWPITGSGDECPPRGARVCRRSPFVVAIENAQVEAPAEVPA